MSDTYNPNELVKRKHFDEFAIQLSHKLDGDPNRTDYPNPQIKGVLSTSTSVRYINITDTNKANLLITQACVGLSVSVQSIEFLYPIATSNADAFNRAPYFKDITSTDGVDRTLVQRNQSTTRWQFFLGGGTEKPAVGTVIKATLCLDGNAFYKDAEWDLTITVI